MKNAAPLIEASTDRSALPEAIYVWLVPSEHMLDQPGSWRIRKWDTEPFPEATHVAAAPQEAPSEAVDETAIQEARIWRVCAVLRPEGCNRCPTEVQTSSYGTGAKACRLIAEKACEAAGTGYVALPEQTRADLNWVLDNCMSDVRLTYRPHAEAYRRVKNWLAATPSPSSHRNRSEP